MTPLLPWRPAILSPTDSLRFIATYTLTSLMTPGGSSSPRRIFSFFSSNSRWMTSTRCAVRSSIVRSSSSNPRSSVSTRARTSVENGMSAIASARERACPCAARARGRPRRTDPCAACGRSAAATSRFFVSSCRMRISSCRFFSIRSSSSCSICLARSSFSMPLREKIRTPTTMPSMPGGQVSDASFTSPAFSPKIARSSFSSGVSWVSPFGVTLPTRMSPGLTLGADADDAALVEVAQVASPRRSGCRA